MGGLVTNNAPNGAQHEVQQSVGSGEKRKRKRGGKNKKKNTTGAVNGYASEGGHEGSPEREAEGSEGGDGKTRSGSEFSGHAIANIPERPLEEPIIERMTSSDVWKDGPDEIPVSIDQLVNGAKECPDDAGRRAIKDWIRRQTAHAYRNLSEAHREIVIDHIFNFKHPSNDPNWMSTIRQTLWRTVIRTSYFWTNPETRETGVKPRPVHRPDGIYENDFRVWLMCAAERADRVGRDLPDPDYVQAVEKEVRTFILEAETKGWWELQCLGFLLMCDEEFKRTLSLVELKERIRKAFRDVRMTWQGCEMFRPGPPNALTNSPNVNMPMLIWEDAKRHC